MKFAPGPDDQLGEIALVLACVGGHLGRAEKRAQMLELEFHEVVRTRRRLEYLLTDDANAVAGRVGRRRRRCGGRRGGRRRGRVIVARCARVPVG